MAVNPTTGSASGGWNEREDIATDMVATDETTKKENSVPFPLFGFSFSKKIKKKKKGGGRQGFHFNK